MSKNIKSDDGDFPFYNGKPLLSRIDWLILIIGVIAFVCITFVPIAMNQNSGSLLYCLVILIPVLYVSRNNLNTMFKKVKAMDLLLIVGCVILYYVYVAVMSYILSYLGAPLNSNTAVTSNMDFISWFVFLMQLLGEELFRIILMLLTMSAVYYFTENRKLSLFIGIIFSILVFGLLHYNSYNGAMLQMILMIGIGSFFYTLAYLKSKNVIVSYIAHVLIDTLPMILLAILGGGA